ncbi:hypothetical protein MRX96_023786 [Rhipicephalus microplus]
MAQILHTTARQLGEEEMFKRLNERYLPITSREDHPDYAGQPNPPPRPRSRGMGKDYSIERPGAGPDGELKEQVPPER